jgi:arylsulfatase A-like enzyme
MAGDLMAPVRVTFVFFVSVLAVGSTLDFCRTGSSQGSASGGSDIVLISIDTLRADHLGCYGYARPTSPNIDALASRSFVFERAYAQSHNTLVSHATLLTSLNPISHGATPRHPIDADIVTLAEVLKTRGYHRAAFTTHPSWLSARMGFAQGFGRFHARDGSAEEINGEVFDWLRTINTLREGGEERPFFLFVHYYDVHSDWDQQPYETGTDYDHRFAGDYDGTFRGCREAVCASVLLSRVAGKPNLLSPEELRWVRALYDGGIAYTDHHVGELLETLRRLDLFDASWIVITSDHGEEFMEHGRMLHSQPYEETARVPLVIRPPGGGSQKRVPQPMGLVDVGPTLLDSVDIAIPPVFEGRSVLPLMDSGEISPAPVFWTALGKPPSYHPSREITVRTRWLTLVTDGESGRLELYSHDTDPTQEHDISSANPSLSLGLRKRVTRFYERQLGEWKRRGTRAAEPNPEEVEMLRKLGYVGS